MGPEATTVLVIYGAEILFYILLLWYVIYGVFLSYHWFTFGNSKTTSLRTLLVYLITGALLFFTMALMLQRF